MTGPVAYAGSLQSMNSRFVMREPIHTPVYSSEMRFFSITFLLSAPSGVSTTVPAAR